MKLHGGLVLFLMLSTSSVVIGMGGADIVGLSQSVFSGFEGETVSICVELIELNDGGDHSVNGSIAFGNFGKLYS